MPAAIPIVSEGGKDQNKLDPQFLQKPRCAVLFGGERNGLSSDDVSHADAILSIPVNPAFASLNLAQAALLVAYEWSRADGTAPVENPMLDTPPASTITCGSRTLMMLARDLASRSQ